MDTQTKIGLAIGGCILLMGAIGGAVYVVNSEKSAYASPSVTSSSINSDVRPSIPYSALSTSDIADEAARRATAPPETLGVFGGKRRRKTRRNVHRLKLLKKKSKGVRRSHRRAHK